MSSNSSTSAPCGSDLGAPQVASGNLKLQDYAARLLRVRRRRAHILGGEMFRDPAWDILLDLYSTTGSGQGTMISSLCVGSGAPQTTALRHVYRLAETGMVECRAHPDDQRRTMVRLAPHMPERIERLLAMIRECG